jgi:uncharacterized protein YciI
MKHFILFYDFVPDYITRRTPFRPAHFAHAQAAVARGEMVLGGACTDGSAPLGVLVFSVTDRATVEDFARQDPYVIEGVATGWHVREWTTVVGKEALSKPAAPPSA